VFTLFGWGYTRGEAAELREYLGHTR
jgi:hypothetical protein